MAMPKGWASQEKTQTLIENDSSKIARMPSPAKLSRPFVTASFLRVIFYPIKKIEIFEIESSERLHPKNIAGMEVHPIEANYCIIFNDGRSPDGLRLPLQNVFDVRTNPSGKLELDFIGTGIIGMEDTKYTATVKTDDRFTNEVFDLVKDLKALENSSKYWDLDFAFGKWS